MRILISEYVNSLREEGELDLLLRNILFVNKFTPTNYPKKGVRQNGVDLEFIGVDEGEKKLIILTVKKGNISRSVWDSGQNSVRQSLNQIIDVHLTGLPPRLKKLPCKIIVATNGEKMQDVEPDWKGYVTKHSTDTINFEFWGQSEIVDLIDDNIVSHALLDSNQKTLFRKALALIEEPDYNLSHVYKLIEEVLTFKKKPSITSLIKKIRLLNLLQGIVHQWCKTANNLKNSYLVSERIFLIFSKYIHVNKLTENKRIQKEIGQIVNKRIEVCWDYFEKIEPQLSTPYGLARYSKNVSHEYPNITINLLGIISQIGIEHLVLFKASDSQDENKELLRKRIIKIVESIILLLSNNPSVCRPNFDDSLIEYSIALNFLYESQNIEVGRQLINGIVYGILDNYKFNRKFVPLFRRDKNRLIEVTSKSEDHKESSSHLMVILAEYALVFGMIGCYRFISSICNEHEAFKELELQLWFPENDGIDNYYSENIMKKNGVVMTAISIPQNYREYRKEIANQMNFISKSFASECQEILPAISSLASRHFRNLPFSIIWRKEIMLFDENGNYR